MAARPEIPVLDFHAHFPVRETRDAAREQYAARFGGPQPPDNMGEAGTIAAPPREDRVRRGRMRRRGPR